MKTLVELTPVSTGSDTYLARGAMVTVGLLFGLYDIQRGIPAEHPWVWGSYVAGLLGAVVLTGPPAGPLRPWRAVLLVVLSLTAGTAVFAHSGLTALSWMFSYAGYLLALMIARGNRVSGGVGGLILIVLGVASLRSHGAAGYLDLVALLGVPVTAMAAGYTWSWWFNRMLTREESLSAATAQARNRAKNAQSSVVSIRQSYRSVHDLAAPLLAPLAAGAEITEELRQTLETVEAEIRDSLVAPGLLTPGLIAAVRHLREHGSRVLILGHVEEDGSSHELPVEVADSIVEELQYGVAVTSVTIRQHPPGSDVLCTLLLVDARGRLRRQYPASSPS